MASLDEVVDDAHVVVPLWGTSTDYCGTLLDYWQWSIFLDLITRHL